MVTVYTRIETDEDSGIEGYLISYDRKRTPSYFEPVLSPRGLAHDVVDHIEYRETRHPIMDELVAIGAAFHRAEDDNELQADVDSLLEAFALSICDENTFDPEDEYYENNLLYVREETLTQFRCLWHKPINEDIQDIFDCIEPKIIRRLSDSTTKWYYRYQKHIRRQVLTALSRGWHVHEVAYGNHYNASNIYSRITDYVSLFATKTSGYVSTADYLDIHDRAPIFRFELNRSEGTIICQHKDAYTSRYYTRTR